METTPKKYVPKQEKRDFILSAAVDLAREKGFGKLYRTDIVKRCGVAAGSVNYCFDDMETLKNEVMKKAIENKELKIIAEGIINSNEIALTAPEELKKLALNSML